MAGPLLGLLPLAGKALMWGGGAAAIGQGAYSASQIGEGMRNDILRDGPNDDGVFKTNPLQNLFIDEQSLLPQYNKRLKSTTMGDTNVTQMQMQLGDKFLYQDGWDAQKTIGANAGLYKKSLQEDKRQANLQALTDQHESPQMIEERRRRDQQRADELAERTATRQENTANRNTTLQLGQINARTAQGNQALQREMNMLQNNTRLQIAQMDSELADKRMAFDRETRNMDKRQRAIAQLMSGLGSLGGAFAL